jgi:UPF0042 nucleotide-binding protein
MTGPATAGDRGGEPAQSERRARRIALITGMSGAGKTSALKALEDLGYESVDHVPLSLLGRLIPPGDSDATDGPAPLAIGIDIRTRDFGVERFLCEIASLGSESGADVRLVFLDCDDDELRRRYTETRHRHPLAVDRPVSDGIALERRMISPLRDRADVVIDTTDLGLGALKRLLDGHFGAAVETSLVVFVTSFSFRHGLPREADLVFDVRFLVNPHYRPELRGLTGRDPAVAEHIRRDEGLKPFLEALIGLMRPLLPRYAAEGKCYLTLAIGCTGGRHRSVFVAEELGAWLKAQGMKVHVDHRDLDRSGEAKAPRHTGAARA